MSKRRILFLYENIGYGHKRVAEAVETYLNTEYPHIKTFSANVIETTHPVLFSLVKNIYFTILSYSAWLWRFLYQNEKVYKSTKFFHTFLYKLARRDFERILDKIKPDTIICSYAFSCGVVSLLKERPNKFNFIIIALSTDFFTHNYWIHSNVDTYCVADARETAILMSKGVNKKNIVITGLPVDKRFSKKNNNKNGMRNKFGFENDKILIMLIGGGLGIGKFKEVLMTLEAIDENFQFQIAVITGHNEKEYNKLKNIKFKRRVRVFGFLDTIDELMDASDILIGKAGGVIVSEAIMKRLPLVFYKSIPGQEQRNVEFLISHGIGYKAENEADLSRIILDLIQNSSKIDKIKLNMEKLNMDDALDKVAAVINN